MKERGPSAAQDGIEDDAVLGDEPHLFEGGGKLGCAGEHATLRLLQDRDDLLFFEPPSLDLVLGCDPEGSIAQWDSFRGQISSFEARMIVWEDRPR